MHTHPESPQPQRRHHHRLPIHLAGILRDGAGREQSVVTVNLSFGGALLHHRGAPAIPVGDEAELHLFVDPDRPAPVIVARVQVAHLRPDGIGVRFLAIDPASYPQLEALMLARAPNPAVLLTELEMHPVVG